MSSRAEQEKKKKKKKAALEWNSITPESKFF